MTALPRRATALTLALAATLLGVSALAQPAWPTRTVRIVCQFPAGGSSDVLARLLAQHLPALWQQAVVVDNRSGAAGILATDHVARSAPDGYTVLITIPAPVTTHLALYTKLPYDPRTQLRMVTDIAVPRTVLVVHPGFPASDFRGVLSVIRAAPDRYAIGSWGPGTLPHQIQSHFDRTQGTQTLHVAYRGEAPLMADLLANVVSLSVMTLATAQSQIDAQRLRPIAVTGARRSALLPNVPTFAEQGFADPVYSMEGPISLMVPVATPDAIVERMARDVGALVARPDVRAQIERLGADPVGNTPREADAGYRARLPIALKLAADTGVKLD